MARPPGIPEYIQNSPDSPLPEADFAQAVKAFSQNVPSEASKMEILHQNAPELGLQILHFQNSALHYTEYIVHVPIKAIMPINAIRNM